MKESSFGKCTKFTKTGQCSSCKTNESEYQGDCYNKIEGCHIQAGPYCVKCSGSYVRFGADCFKECSYFFKWGFWSFLLFLLFKKLLKSSSVIIDD